MDPEIEGSSIVLQRFVGLGSASRVRMTRRVWASVAALTVAMTASGAWASGGIQVQNVAAGSAQFSGSGNLTRIHAADKTIINYSRFDVGAGHTVQFVQPSSTARVLNRINSAAPSRIDGTITANGTVYFVNRAGMVFGPNSVVNAGRIYAGAAQITDMDFLGGIDRFKVDRGAVLTNYGTLRAEAVHLIGGSVENFGAVVAERGIVTLAAGDEVFIGKAEGGLMLRVSGEKGAGGEKGVSNAGTIEAAGGEVTLAAGDMFAVAASNSGKIAAKQVTVDGGKGLVKVGGTIDASDTAAGGKGGTVKVLADKVSVNDGTIDVSGASGGGEVLVGGNFQGKGPEQNASRVFVGSGSVILADALVAGDGGRVIVWSDDMTGFAGKISARGGANGGSGGFVEVSGKETLLFQGTVDLRAPLGAKGTLLLDPGTLNVDAGAADAGADDAQLNDRVINAADGTPPPNAVFTITNGKVVEQLGLGDVVLQAGTAVNINAAIVSGTANDLGVQAATITLGADVSTGGDQLYSGNVVLGANRAITANAMIVTGSVTGAFDLNVTGNAAFGSANIASLTVSGIMVFGGNVTTTANQNYGGGDLNANALLTAPQVTFTGSINGDNFNLSTSANGTFAAVAGVGTLGVGGDAVFNGSVTGVNVLSVTGTSAINNATITTATTQTYTGDVTLGQNTAFTGTLMTFDGVLNGATFNVQVNGNASFQAMNSVGALGVTGTASFNDTTAAASINVLGVATFNVPAVTTTGNQSYGGGVLTGNTTLTGPQVTFTGALNGGGFDLDTSANGTFAAVNTVGALTVAGNAVFNGDVTGTGSIAVTGTTLINAANITTTTTQTYTNFVTLGANTALTGTQATFLNDLGGAFDITINGNAAFQVVNGVGALGVTGDATFNNTVNAGSLNIIGTATINTATITTTTTQAYGDGLLGAALTATGTSVVFSGLTGGGFSLDIVGAGGLTNATGLDVVNIFGNAVLSTSVSANSVFVQGTAQIGGTVTTTGTQDYGGGLLTANAVLTATQATFSGTLTGGGFDLDVGTNGTFAQISGVGALTVGGNAVFNGSVTGTGSIAVTGTSAINTGTITTTTTQTYTGAVTLGQTTAFTGTTITFSNALNGATFDATVTGNASLQVINAVGALGVTGTASFNDTVNAGSINVTGVATFNVAAITTTGNQSYGGGVLTANTLLTAPQVTFTGTITGGGFDLATSANGTFAQINNLGALTVPGDAVFNGDVNATSVAVTGTTQVGGVITTSTPQVYSGTVTLVGNSNFTATLVTFSDTLTGAGFGATVTGDGTFAQVTGVGALTVTGNAVFNNTVNASSVLVNGTTAANGGSVTTTGNQTYDGVVTLGQNTTFAGATVTFNNTLEGGGFDASVTGNGVFGLVNAVDALGATGTAAFNGTVNAASVTVGGVATFNIAGITTTGNQSYGGGVLTANTVLTAPQVTFTGAITGGGFDLSTSANGTFAQINNLVALTVPGNAVFNGNVNAASVAVTGTTQVGAVTLTTSTPLTFTNTVTQTGSAQYVASQVTFNSALNAGGFNVTVTGNGTFAAVNSAGALAVTGNAVFGNTVIGGTVAVTGTTNFNSALVLTTGTQTYTGGGTLGTNTTLTGAGVTFGNTLTGGGFDLLVNSNGVFAAMSGVDALGVTGTARFNGAVNATSVNILGIGTFVAGTVTTTGNQTYGGGNLDASVLLTAPQVTFSGTVTGDGFNLTTSSNGTFAAVSGVNALAVGGNGVFNGAVNAGSVSVTGTSAVSTGVVTTTGTQVYTGAVTVTPNVVFTGSTVTFSSDLSGGNVDVTVTGNGVFAGVSGLDALVVTGNATFGGVVSTSTVAVTGTTQINTVLMSTSGTQTYTGAVTLGSTTTFSGTQVTFSNTLTGGGFGATVSADGTFALVTGVGALSVTGNGVFNNTVNAGSVAVTGTADINGGAVTTTGTQIYNGIATLGANTVLTGAGVTFNTTLNGGGFDLTVNGAGDFAEVLGVDVLTVAGDAVFGNTVNGNQVTVTGTAALGGASVTTTGTQTYGAANLAADVTLTGSGVTVSGAVAGNGFDLTVVGNSVFANLVGVDALSLTNTQLNGVVQANSVNVTGTTALNAPQVTAPTQTYGGTLTLLQNSIALQGGGTVTTNGIDGAIAGLTITGNAVINGPVTLSALEVWGTTALNVPGVNTTATQIYGGLVTASVAPSFTGTTVTFNTGLNANGGAVVITGNAELGGGSGIATLAVSGTTTVFVNGVVTTSGDQTYTGGVTMQAGASLTSTGGSIVSGGPTTLGGAVTSAGSQTFSGNVLLAADATLTSSMGNVLFSGTINSADATPRALTINVNPTAARSPIVTGGLSPVLDATYTQAGSTGQVFFTSDVGATNALSGLTINLAYVGNAHGTFVHFTGGAGVQTVNGGLRIAGSGRSESNLFAAVGRYVPGSPQSDSHLVVTSNAAGGVSIGEKISVLGDLRFDAPTVALSDVTSIGAVRMLRSGTSVTILGRTGGNVAQFSKLLLDSGQSGLRTDTASDTGVDLIAGGGFIGWDGPVSFSGGGASPRFSDETGTGIGSFLALKYPETPGLTMAQDLRQNLLLGNPTGTAGVPDLLFDLRSEGQTPLQTVTTKFVIRSLAEPPISLGVSEETAKAVEQKLGLRIRPRDEADRVGGVDELWIYNDFRFNTLTPSERDLETADRRLTAEAIGRVLAKYDELKIGSSEPDQDEIRLSLAAAWQVYSKAATEPTAGGFVAFLAKNQGDVPEANRALLAMAKLRGLFVDLEATGLSSRELLKSKRFVVERVLPEALRSVQSRDAFLEALEREVKLIADAEEASREVSMR